MKTILIPVDFSNTSSNALQFIADLNQNIDIEKIILLKTHYVSIYSSIIPSGYGQSNAEYILQERTETEEQLTLTGQQLLKRCKAGVQIEVAVSDLPILRAIHDMIRDQSPTLLVLGSDASNDESPLGEYVIEIAQISSIPVLIIPSASKYRKVERVLVPCGAGAIPQLPRLNRLRQMLPNPELVILNVDHKHTGDDENYRTQIKEMLGDFSYTVYYAQDKNIAKGILDFAKERKNIQLIVALPGKYSFFYNLTHQNITEAITLNAKIPVLIFKEN
ncbi:universal stress protein [Dyadobacter subterraneus]|uniref:Universal stress protein n=1 Tax=Dyadobacter subterraneus TaxID=2773304 RepID=A0ABR9WEB1_9BACT|nr:universal stress protein [Dyadobacter subterraneus]MBE9463464.1 universal stress protein [Dyadobacter subterraneus]